MRNIQKEKKERLTFENCPDVMDGKEIADLLHISPKTVNRMATTNEIGSFTIRRARRFIRIFTIYENIIAESLTKNGMNLYYFSKSSGLGIDFVTNINHKIVPLEVKATNENAKLLKEVLNNKGYSINKAIKLINGNIGEINNIYYDSNIYDFLD